MAKRCLLALMSLVISVTINRLTYAEANESPSSIFDIPAKSPEELRKVLEDLPQLRANAKRHIPVPLTEESKEEAKLNRERRMKERRERAKRLILEHQPEPGVLDRMSDEEIRRVYGNAIKEDPELKDENNKWLRGLGSNNGNSIPSSLAPIDEYYDKWAQGYRMLGGFIDCSFIKHGGSHDGGGDGKCSRWMMWAAYVNPNYQGGGRDEYFSYNTQGDDASEGAASSLDCHSPNTEWILIGVYRQEFYQFIEQISKHLWAIDDYEYAVALASLSYMTDGDCWGAGYGNNGEYLYAGTRPISGGNFMMSLYSDDKCIYPDTTSGMTYDDFGFYTDLNLGSKDDGTLSDDSLANLYEYWQNSQEYTLELVNTVYSEYKYCTLCMDYPTYQDGYFIGDTGTDDGDLINQCWKFHSHDSYTCTAECIALGNAQGTILQVNYLGKSYGQSWDGSSGVGTSTTFDHYSKGYTAGTGAASKFKANAFLTFNAVLFIATFLAFSVARGSRADSSDKSKPLLEKKRRSSSSKKERKSSSRSKSATKKKSSSSRPSRSRSNGRGLD